MMYNIDDCDLPYRQFHNDTTMASWIHAVHDNIAQAKALDEQERSIEHRQKKQIAKPIATCEVSRYRFWEPIKH